MQNPFTGYWSRTEDPLRFRLSFDSIFATGRATILPEGCRVKGLGRDIMIALVVGVVMPALAIRAGIALRFGEETIPASTLPPPQEETVIQPSVLEILFRDRDGVVVTMGLDDYLVGAVLGEMPASFEQEALKAQAVAARTYAWKAKVTGGKHGDGSVCADPGCCQAYISEDTYVERGGAVSSVEKIRSAVLDTSDQVLTFEGVLIEATYFSCSGGRTEDAVAVWGNDFPYLRSVESPGEEEAAWFTDEAEFYREELEDRLGITLSGDASGWFTDVTLTNGGGVETVRIGADLFSGTRVRSLLGLRSTAFTVSGEGEKVIITTRGYGHRVGLSQYGADAMAATGAGYREILAHYYPGTQLTRLE